MCLGHLKFSWQMLARVVSSTYDCSDGLTYSSNIFCSWSVISEFEDYIQVVSKPFVLYSFCLFKNESVLVNVTLAFKLILRNNYMVFCVFLTWRIKKSSFVCVCVFLNYQFMKGLSHVVWSLTFTQFNVN